MKGRGLSREEGMKRRSSDSFSGSSSEKERTCLGREVWLGGSQARGQREGKEAEGGLWALGKMVPGRGQTAGQFPGAVFLRSRVGCLGAITDRKLSGAWG